VILPKLLRSIDRSREPGSYPVETEASEATSSSFPMEELGQAAHVMVTTGTAPGSPWDAFRGRFLSLPSHYDFTLDPLSPAYAAQQDRLWQDMSGYSGEYRAEQNEQTPEVAQIDAITRPGFYAADTRSAGDHLIALGHLVKLSDIAAGECVLEYGAGFGQIALTFARLGALVDTVDINPHFCRAVRAQAAWFGVPLTAHVGHFGDNPRPAEKYKLIVFYECFHHAREFVPLIKTLHGMLADDGKILLAGEPIVEGAAPEIPYPWGIRLDAENSAIVRLRGWYEIGFQENFLLGCFIRSGFTVQKHPGIISRYANTYEFRKRPRLIKLSEWTLLPSDAETWHAVEPDGRWTKDRSTFHLDCMPGWTSILIVVQNCHAMAVEVKFIWDGQTAAVLFLAGEQREVSLERRSADWLEIISDPVIPRSYGVADDRSLGVFVKSIEFCSAC
jgi:SAM-dependent methyltransferase